MSKSRNALQKRGPLTSGRKCFGRADNGSVRTGVGGSSGGRVDDRPTPYFESEAQLTKLSVSSCVAGSR
jgi:hypothetical protein